MVRFPAWAHILILSFLLTFHCLQLGEDHINEIKHDIHIEKWMHRTTFNSSGRLLDNLKLS